VQQAVAGAEQAVVVTNGRPEIAAALVEHFPGRRLSFVTQDPPRGTGDAVSVAMKSVSAERVLILCGDTPLLEAADLSALLQELEQHPDTELAFASCLVEDPTGYGRVLRNGAG
jgi:bifunctional UDP-N-acetylglucosamine pyrophosphorylase/glucosamine-1-phosphate N-acetyltransferase